MMGQHARSESLFYYFRLDDQVPENHLLRLVDKHIDFGFVRNRLEDSYSETGRPSIDPELLLRILLIGYLYGISSERKLVEELRMHLAWRWFTGLGFDQEIPHYSSCSSSCLRRSWRLPGGGTGARGQSVGRWQFRGGQCQQGEPNPAGAVSGSGRGEPNRAPVPGGTGAAEPHRRALAPARPGIDHRSRCDLRDQGWNSRPAGLLRQLPGGIAAVGSRKELAPSFIPVLAIPIRVLWTRLSRYHKRTSRGGEAYRGSVAPQ